MTKETNWSDEVRLKMIEKSEFYQEPRIYQYGFYDGYQLATSQSEARDARIKELEGFVLKVFHSDPDKSHLKLIMEANKLLNP